MKIILDTVNSDFLMILLNENNQIIQIYKKENIKYKVELIPEIFREFLTKEKIKVSDISKYYTNIGPGSFTGARIGLVFFRTLVQLNPNSSLFVINNFSWIAGPYFTGQVYIDAKNKKYYSGFLNKGVLQDQAKIEYIENGVDLEKIDYEFIIENISKYLDLFNKVDNLLEVNPIYLNDPQIGG